MPPKTSFGSNLEAQLEHDLRVRQELRDILLIKARSSFYTFVQLMAPVIIPGFIDGKHIKLVADTLEWAYKTDNARVMIFLPPGAMKSRLGSILFPAWVFGQRPDWQILHVGHSADFTASFGADIRDLMCLDEYKEIFPNLSLDDAYQAREHWRTKQKGIYRSAGVGGAIAGKRANIAIADDLISEQNADSKAENEKVHKWWPRGLETRILPKGKIVLINTRWSNFDCAGWLLDRAHANPTLSQWKVVKIPALLDKAAAKMLGGVEGESYWPEFYDTDTVKRMQTGMPRSHWLATYQQEPIALDGNIIKTEHFQDWGKKGKGEIEHVIASLDTAFSTSTHADHSVIQVWGVFNQRRVDSEGTERDIKCLVLLDQHRGKWEYPELIKHCQEVEDDHVPDTWLIEKKASGHCYDDETEVLTKNGWKLFKDVNISKDAFATRKTDGSGLFEWQKATSEYHGEYQGDMYQFKGKTQDLLVTPNHRMLVNSLPRKLGGHPSKRARGREEFITAEELFKFGGEKTKTPLTSSWVGSEILKKELRAPEEIETRAGKTPAVIEIDGDTYIKLMAMYLAEGWTQKVNRSYSVHIGQKEGGRHYKDFLSVMEKFGIVQQRRGNDMYLCNRHLYEFIRQFGLFCDSKRIPDDILNSTPRQLNLFWDWYLKGDGHKTALGHEAITTTSKILAGQLQELAIKAGFSASVRIKKPPESPFRIGNNKGLTDPKNLKISYRVTKRTSKFQKLAPKKVQYNGYVHCVTVPNGTLYVRRNGFSTWCGNSLIQDLRRRGYFVVEYSPDKDKLTRVISATPFIEDERIYVPMHLIWCQDFIDECQAFGGKKTDKDDQVDAMSQAVIWLRDSHYLNYEGEVSLEELEDERQTRVSKQRFYW